MPKVTFGQLESWGSASSQGGTEKDDFLNMKEDGIYQIRTVTEGAPYEFAVHWAQNTEGKARKINCAGRDCLLCKEGNEPQVKYMIAALNRDKNRVQVVEFGKQVYTALKKHAFDPDWGDPRNYDIKIDKDRGRGASATYILTAKPTGMGPLSQEESQKVKEFLTRVNLDRLSAPSTEDEILRKLGRKEMLPATAQGSWGARSATPPAASANAAKAVEPAGVSGDEDFDF
jgi:hypothetical protein